MTKQTPAIRTVSEDDTTHTIEMRLAYGGPFRGKDSYQTYFSARTDWGLDLHPEGVPVLFNHGFDPDFGLTPIGRTSPTSTFRSEADGMWVQAQLDKRNAYYATRVRPLLDANGLGASQGSAEHSVRIDARTGEVQAWPLQEVSLTPTEANPWNTIAARSAETAGLLIVASRDVNGPPEGGEKRKDIPAEDFAGPDKSYPIVDQSSVDAAAKLYSKAADPEAVKAKIISIAKRKGLDIPDAWKGDRTGVRQAGAEAAMGAGVLASLLYLMDCEADEPDQLAMLQGAADSLTDWVTAERAEVGTTDDDMMAVMTAIRAGKRNSGSDQTLIDDIHDRSVRLGASAHQGPDDAQANDDSPPAESEDDAARSGDTVPRLLVVREPADPDAIRAAYASDASAIGAQVARDMLAAAQSRRG